MESKLISPKLFPTRLDKPELSSFKDVEIIDKVDVYEIRRTVQRVQSSGRNHVQPHLPHVYRAHVASLVPRDLQNALS